MPLHTKKDAIFLILTLFSIFCISNDWNIHNFKIYIVVCFVASLTQVQTIYQQWTWFIFFSSVISPILTWRLLKSWLFNVMRMCFHMYVYTVENISQVSYKCAPQHHQQQHRTVVIAQRTLQRGFSNAVKAWIWLSSVFQNIFLTKFVLPTYNTYVAR